MATIQKLAPVVSVLNMKGGVGKTTVSAHIFRLLWEHLQKSTVLIDLDPQFNLTQTLVKNTQYELAKKAKKTIMRVMEPDQAPSLLDIIDNTQPAPTERSLSQILWHFPSIPDNNLSLLPGDFGLVKYSLIASDKPLLPIRKRFLAFIEETRTQRDLICIDCNPSSSFLTLCAVMASTHILIPVRPDKYSVMGLNLLYQFLHQIPELPTPPKLIVLFNGLPPLSKYDSQIEDSVRASSIFGPVTLTNTISISSLLQATHSYTGFATDRPVANRNRLKARLMPVVDELGIQLGLKK